MTIAREFFLADNRSDKSMNDISLAGRQRLSQITDDEYRAEVIDR
jgi:hypothetical protein